MSPAAGRKVTAKATKIGAGLPDIDDNGYANGAEEQSAGTGWHQIQR
jgi:hypothetical protein